MNKRGVYKHMVNPLNYSIYAKRPVKVATRNQLGNKIQYCSIRILKTEKKTRRMTYFRRELDAYTVRKNLGDVVWPIATRWAVKA